MGRVITTLAALAAMASAGMAMADKALVIGASEEERRGFWRTGSGIDSAGALRAAGFEVITADAGSISEMRAALSRFLDGVESEERVVVHLSGNFLNGAGRNWLVEAGNSARPDLGTVDNIGLSLETVLAIAGRVPGASVVALGIADERVEAGAGLAAGLAGLTPPQGVTLVDGPSEQVARFVAGPLLEEGQSVPDAIAEAGSLRSSGFLSQRVVFLPEGEERPVAPPNAAEVERAIWQATLAQDDVAGYEGYLERYPEGFLSMRRNRPSSAFETSRTDRPGSPRRRLSFHDLTDDAFSGT